MMKVKNNILTSKNKRTRLHINPNRYFKQLIKYMKRVQRRIPKKSSQVCNICMIKPQDTIILPCNHKICYKCISKWAKIKQNCPYCRAQISRIQYKSQIKQIQVFRVKKMRKNFDFIMSFPYLSPTTSNEQPVSNSPVSEEAWILTNLINSINNSAGILNYVGYFEERLVEVNQSESPEQQRGDEAHENTN